MIIKERIKLGKTNYYISVDCEYKIKNGFSRLCLRNNQNDYYDGGDLSILIKEIESKYNRENCKRYDGEAWFLSDCLYVYDNIPFISGIGDIYDNDGIINSVSYITKEELDKYIKEKNIVMKDHSDFKLSDGRTWNVK